ncbi:MAG: OmpH family outer membrane protein [Crocinitomicaceae bacterium]|nr:OmpH family outer membrane protein [Crocinitomicaceae bacterium]
MKKIVLALVIMVGLGSTAIAQSKIAHVKSQTLLDTLPSRIAALDKLKKFELEGIAELQEMKKDFEVAVAKYDAEARDMSPVIRQIEEEKLMKKQQAFQEREQSLNYEMQAYQQELNAPILQMVQDAVKVVSERMKLNYVIDESVTLYFAGGTDITDEVAAELLKMDAAANSEN